jgi:hypothetical protein
VGSATLPAAGGWNLLNQNGMPLLAVAEARGIDVHIAGIFSSGLLAGGTTVYAAGSDNGQSPPAELAAKAKGWGKLADEHGLALPDECTLSGQSDRQMVSPISPLELCSVCVLDLSLRCTRTMPR